MVPRVIAHIVVQHVKMLLMLIEKSVGIQIQNHFYNVKMNVNLTVKRKSMHLKKDAIFMEQWKLIVWVVAFTLHQAKVFH